MNNQGSCNLQIKRFFLILSFIIAGFFYFQVLNFNDLGLKVIEIKISQAAELININTASLAELDSLPGIGPAKAQAIIDYRIITLFTVIDDLKNVSGIGDSTFNEIKSFITVGVSSNVTPDDTPIASEPHDSENEISVPAPVAVKIKAGDVLISEFVSDPADEDIEWIEIVNNSNRKIDLEGWVIKEGSGSETKLAGEFGTDGNGKYIVIEKPSGNLNNKGDIIILLDPDNTIIDQVAYGNWNDGNINDNAPAAEDPYSCARIGNSNDFSITSSSTPKAPNLITEIDTTESENTDHDFSKDIIISEIFPDPDGSDIETEWIEFFNKSQSSVNLFGWRVGDNSKYEYEIKKNLEIMAGGYLIINRKESGLALNNTGDSVKLFEPLKDEPTHTVKYEKAISGWSYSLVSGKRYEWTKIISPGKPNIIKTANRAPEADFNYSGLGRTIYFDSSDSFDPDENKLYFNWDFGDGLILNIPNPEHTFLTDGSFKVKLSVGDGEATSTKEEIIFIGDEKKNAIQIVEPALSSLVINEILPSPVGSDIVGEWIEIKNSGETIVNLKNWQIDDEEGGSSPFKFNSDILLNPGNLLIINRASSSVSLNNTGDSVRLFGAEGKIVDQVDYGETVENESYARGLNGKFFWTSLPTPDAENIIASSEEQISVTNARIINTQEEYLEVELCDLKELESGVKVVTSGFVTALPGVFAAQYFYISNSGGAQIYNFKKDFPNLRIGDLIEVKGELSVINRERRIKTKIADDMRVVSQNETSQPQEIVSGELNDELLGELVAVSGEITDKKSTFLYLDDGEGEMEIYLKKNAGVSAENIMEGQRVKIIGIVAGIKSGIRIMPRSTDDIIIENAEGQLASSQVLGESETGDEWQLEQRDKKQEVLRYFLIILALATATLIGLLWKILKKKSS